MLESEIREAGRAEDDPGGWKTAFTMRNVGKNKQAESYRGETIKTKKRKKQRKTKKKREQ